MFDPRMARPDGRPAESPAWPIVTARITGGHSGEPAMTTGQDIRQEVEVLLGIYMADPSDYHHLARCCYLITLAVQQYPRARGKTALIAPVTWALVDWVGYPFAAARVVFWARPGLG